MPSVQNIGPVDYPQVQAQNQPQELQEYMSEPQVYDAEFEEKKAASGSMKGLTALGVILGVAGIGYGIVKGRAASKYKQQAEILEQEVSKLKNQVQDEKGFIPYMKRVVTGSYIYKFITGLFWRWPKAGCQKIAGLFKKGAKDAPKA